MLLPFEASQPIMHIWGLSLEIVVCGIAHSSCKLPACPLLKHHSMSLSPTLVCDCAQYSRCSRCLNSS